MSRRGSLEGSLCLAAVVLAAVVLSVYWQAGGHPFMDIDDDLYVSRNPFVLQGLAAGSVSWAFTTFHSAHWHPLTWLSHMLDVELFGPSAGWHHRMNVLYHLTNTELLFFLLWRMTGGLWQSAFAAALFGVHPLNVESVAWITERKNLMSTLFGILTIGAYLRHVRRPGAGRYLAVGAAFATSLMCKPMLVTLPFALLLLDWWPLGRYAPADSVVSPSWRHHVSVFLRLLREKVPLLGLSAVSCAVAYLAARESAVSPLESVSLGARVSNALLSYAAYLGKAAWPSSLAVFYPHPASVHAEVSAWETAGAVLLLAGLSAVALWQRSRRPYLAVGWLWFLGTLVPVIGVVQVGGQAMADRYTYLPMIGIFIAVAWGVPSVMEGDRLRRMALSAGAGLLLALSAAAWNQATYWSDSVKLFSRTLAITEKNWFVWNSLGVSYYKRGNYPQAIACFEEALWIRPDFSLAWNNLGLGFARLGRLQEAVRCFLEALRHNPDFTEAHNNLVVAREKIGG